MNFEKKDAPVCMLMNYNICGQCQVIAYWCRYKATLSDTSSFLFMRCSCSATHTKRATTQTTHDNLSPPMLLVYSSWIPVYQNNVMITSYSIGIYSKMCTTLVPKDILFS